MARGAVVAVVAVVTIVAVGAIGALLGGCHHPPPPLPPPVLDEIVARYKHDSALVGPDEAALASLAREALAAAPGPLAYAPHPADARAPRARLIIDVALGYEPGERGKGVLHAEVHARIAPKQEGAGALTLVEREGLVEKEGLDHVPLQPELRDHLRRAFELIVTSAMRGEQLWLAAPAAARAAIGGADAELRDEAIRIAGERRDREAAPLLLPLLRAEDVELRDRAIGALAEIGDPRTVKPLAELAKFGDMTELPKILDAIERVGGPEAVAYLEFVSTAHPSEEIRDEAKRALEHLHARVPKN